MNILVVHNYYKIRAGEESVFNNEIKMLKEHGHNIEIYTRDNAELDSFSPLQKATIPFSSIFSFRTFFDVKRIIREKSIDIVHVHNYICLISPSVYYACFSMGIPVIQTIHHFRLNCAATTLSRNGKVCMECIETNMFHSLKYRCYRNSFFNTLGIAVMVEFHKMIGTYNKINFICLTQFNKELLLKINKEGREYIKEKNVYIKPNFSPFHHELIPFEERKMRMIYAGRLYQNKGIRLLLEAWKSIKDYDLLVFGSGPEEEWCRNFIKDNGLKNIKMMGYVSNEELADYISDSRAVILPTQWFEQFPMILVESFSCGTPVVGSNIGNTNDIIKEGINGYHFNYSSSESLVKVIKNMKDISDSTYNYSCEKYDSEKNYMILMDIYKDISNEKAGDFGKKA